MLEDFLNAKPLYYDEIDYTRMPRVYETIKSKLKLPKIIHIIGTNGKGTTGRFLASALCSLGYKVGHYTSPHIIKFNERIWLNGESVSDALLNKAHYELLLMISKSDAEALSYFEYTTLLAIYIYQELDYIVLEAGLGGEYDATAVFENILTLVTPIDIDHEAFLGSDIQSIATTKLNAIEKSAIIAKQRDVGVMSVASSIAQTKNIKIESLESYINESDKEKIEEITKRNQLVEYLQNNLTLAVSALNFLGIEYAVKDFDNSRLYGRLTQFKENIILDVGHNTLAAESICKSLKPSTYTLIYNSYKDKNYKKILTLLKPIISDIEIISIDDARIESEELMQQVIEDLGYNYKKYSKIQKNKNYLVFGSFSVVEAFLESYDE